MNLTSHEKEHERKKSADERYFEEFVDLWAMGKLSEPENKIFNRLLVKNPKLRKKAHTLKKAIEGLKSLPLETLLPPNIAKKVRRILLRDSGNHQEST